MRRAGRQCFAATLAGAVLLLPVAAALLLPASAIAHAVLESSKPAAGSTVEISPRRIVLTFSEAPDVKLSLVRVIDARGVAVPGVLAPQPVPADKQSLEVLPSTPLVDGTYTVNYRVVSTVDGHVGSGAFAFGVGQAAGKAVVVQLVHTSKLADWLVGVGRWLLYGALVVLIGATTTSVLVYRVRLPQGGIITLRWALVAAAIALALMTWGEKILVGARTLMPLLTAREGFFLLALALTLGWCTGAVVLVDLWPARWSLWLSGAAGAAAVAAHVAAGHAASPSSVWLLNVFAQWVHMTAVGIWIGGLFWLLLGFRGRDHDARATAVARFTRIATWTLAGVLATGLARAVVEVGSVSALFDTRYGLTLMVKIALVAGLVSLGALNHYFWVPALRRNRTAGDERRFGLNSRAELIVAVAVLAMTAVLSGLVPAGTAAAARSEQVRDRASITASGHDYATSMRVELTLTPGRAGRNTYVLWVDDYDTGDPLTSITSVRLQCAPPNEPGLSTRTAALARAPDGSWTGSGLDFSVAGLWKVAVYVQQQSAGTIVELSVPVRSPSPP